MQPIPAAKKSDHEDVAWALSTAEAQWGRGEKLEALKWLRRAADAASEAEDDVRALELAKAAAELSSLFSTPPPASKPPPLPSKPPPVVLNPPPKPVAKAPTASKPLPQKKAPRKSVPAKEEVVVPRPAAHDATPRPDQVEEPRSQMPTLPPAAPSAAEADAWPTDTHELPVFGTERTRIGTAAYQPPDPTRVLPLPAEPKAVAPAGGLQSSQAVRVVVWRDSNGVHVAPAGTTVSAITVDAMLVAMDPGADLSAWLSRK